MSRILKRPMFRRGGSTNTGIMSGITDRTNYENGGIDLSGINKERLRGSATAIQSLLNELSPVPKTRLPIGQFGLNIASGMSLTDALRDPLAQFTTPAQVKERFPSLPEGSIVQIKPDGEAKITKPDAASVKKRADLKSTIGLLNRVEEKYLELGKPVSGPFSVDPDRLSGQIGQFFGTKKGRDYATLKSDIDKTTTFLTQAISGAQVSEQEAERIRRLIPQLNDTEAQFESKLKSLRAYLGEAVRNYGGDVEELMRAGVSAADFLPTRQKDLEDMSDEELQKYEQELLKLQG